MNYITFILKKKEIWIRRYIVFSCQLCRFYLLLVLVIVLPNYHITLGYKTLTTRGLRHLSPWKMPFYWISNEPKHFNYIFYHDNKKKSIYTSYWLPKYRYFFLNLPINIASVLMFTFLTPISTFGTSLNTLLMKMLHQFPPNHWGSRRQNGCWGVLCQIGDGLREEEDGPSGVCVHQGLCLNKASTENTSESRVS